MKDRLFHVTTAKKLKRYKKTGFIRPPVRAWGTMQAAKDFSLQTGRKVIVVLIDDGSFDYYRQNGKIVGNGFAFESDKRYDMENY